MSRTPGPRLARRPAFALLSLILVAAALCYVVARPPAARAASVTVTNTNDSGPGSLRQAILSAANGDTINFDTAGVFATPQTIMVTSGGPLDINKDLTIQGPGASQLTISGGNASRVFLSLWGNTVTLDGLTVSGGRSGADGGGIFKNSGTVTISNCVVSGNVVTAGGGGGIFNGSGPMTIINSTVSGNSALSGGGILTHSGGTLTIINSSVSGNSAGPGGGGGISIGSNGVTLTITNSTVSNNSATGNGGGLGLSGVMTLNVLNSTVSGNSANTGGGFFFNGAPTLKLINSTVSGNSARVDGGGFAHQGMVEATNSTITGNRADSDGDAFGAGGGFHSAGRKLNNTIVAGNFRGTGSTPDDINGPINTANNNVIGDAATSGGITHGVNGNKVGFAASAVLNTTLANNGGPTLTHALVPGGPAYNAGSNALAVDAASQPLTTDQRGAGFPRTIASAVDIGSYEAPCAMLVTTTADSGAGSLRQTIADACPNGTITFDTSGAFATPQTITLTSGELFVNKSLTIDGPGASQLTVSGNNASRVFFVKTGNTVTLDGLTVSGGNGLGAYPSGDASVGIVKADGGGIYNEGALTVTNCTVSGNSSDINGGGIAIRSDSSGTLTLTNSTVSGNSALLNGGGVHNSAGTVTITNSTISNNSGFITGGGILNIDAGTVTVTNSTVSGNIAEVPVDGGLGGGIINFDGTLTVTNSTISGNSARTYGGGIVNGGVLTVTNSTVTGNRADSDGNAFGAGGGIAPAGTETLNNTIVAGNFVGAGSTPDDIITDFGPIEAANNNLIGDAATSGGITHGTNGNKVGNNGVGTLDINTVLNTTLANNGGPTLTHALAPTSPAIDQGHGFGSTTDQRGSLRPFDDPAIPDAAGGDGSDIGAYENFNTDSDTDGVPDFTDNCPAVANPGQANNDGDSLGDACDPDDDNDGVEDGDDCAPFNAAVSLNSTFYGDADADGFGDPNVSTSACTAPLGYVSNNTDNCPAVANPSQADNESDGSGDVCDADDDNDGVSDTDETTAGSDPFNAASTPEVCDGINNDLNDGVDEGFPDTDNDDQADCIDADDDGDGVNDTTDNCPATSNPDQADADGDGTGNVCDLDDDGDNVPDVSDNCPLASNPLQTDTDNDGSGDACDSDDDNDGVSDTTDNCALAANANQANNDGDGQGDVCDADDDNDGVADATDNCPLAANPDQADTDGDGIGNTCDTTVIYSVCVLYDQNKLHKGGSTVPVKLQLCDAGGNNQSAAARVLKAVGVMKVSDAAFGPVEDSGSANPDFNFRYDATLGGPGGGYIFNLSTKGYSTGTYRLGFRVGSEPYTYTVQFKIK